MLGQLLVQFRDEDWPCIYELPDCEDYKLIHSGKHVFVYTSKSDESLSTDGWVMEETGMIFYASERGLLPVMPHDDDDMHSLRPEAVYDGYFCFSGASYGLYFGHVGLDERYAIDSLDSKGLYGIYTGKTGSMILQRPMICDCYFWDMASNTLTPSLTSFQVQTSDIPIFLSVAYPGIDSVDLEMAEAQEEVPIEPERAPFFLFAALHHLVGTLKEIQNGQFVQSPRISDTWGSS